MIHSFQPAELRLVGGRMLRLVGWGLVACFLGLLLQMDLAFLPNFPPPRALAWMLLDLSLLLLVMTYFVVRRAAALRHHARSGQIGTRLQSRIVILFSVIAIVPTVAVSLFSAFFFNVGIKSWFDQRVSGALQESVTVAAAYVREHKGAIRTDALSMATHLQPNLEWMMSNPEAFHRLLEQLSRVHDLSEAMLYDGQQVVARTDFSFSLTFERLPEEVLERAQRGDVVVFGEDENKIQAVVQIHASPPLYLMIGRVVDPQVLEHMESARSSVTQYQQLQGDITVLQQQFFLVFVLVALLILLASVWAGMLLAMRLIGPIAGLMAATERVRTGDYSMKVPEGRTDDEIANLGRTFNRMTEQLEAQRSELMTANYALEERRRFIEAVLSGVTAGILALDGAQRITLHNRMATLHLRPLPSLASAPEADGSSPETSLIGTEITTLLPDLAPLLAQVRSKPSRVASANLVLEGENNTRITLHAQVTAECLNQTIEGFIVTLDDITALLSAQRSAAWADVARRIAHEIKNPLTPITLSTDRLRKKFSEEITSDREAYGRYLDTITRHVRDIGRMVEEFVAFARMPTPSFREENLTQLIRKSVFSEQTVHPEIAYRMELPEAPVRMVCDESQLGRMLQNLMKNAAEAMEVQTTPKAITLTLIETPEALTLTLTDTGAGFPVQHLATLMEPYVTTRAKGTGLGLAIVKRTMEDHKGSVTLSNLPEGGACVTLLFPRTEKQSA